MDEMRIFGNNCRLLMMEQGISQKKFAEKLGYSKSDVKRLLDGRLLLFDDDIRDIAAFFSKTRDEMFEIRGTDEYKGSGFPQCIGNFSNPENMEFHIEDVNNFQHRKEKNIMKMISRMIAVLQKVREKAGWGSKIGLQCTAMIGKINCARNKRS